VNLRRQSNRPAILRRLALGAGLVSSLALGEPAAQARGARPAVAAATPPDTLIAPPLLENLSTVPGVVEVNLTAAPARLPLLPGHPTDVYAFNGRIPGPTLELHEGDRVIVHFHNALPEPTTIHWHGLHIPAASDGSPLSPIAPGASYDYVFTVAAGSAGTYWYHPHPHQRTGFQIASGLYGALIIRAPDDPLPASIPEKLLILADNRLLPDGSLDFPDPYSPQGQVDMENGREGELLFVNGQLMPTIPIRSGEVQRWRIINASAARVYRLAIPGQTLLHVGSDGGLFERPVEVPEILVANSERVEVLVRGTGPRGSQATLQTLPYDRYIPQTRPADWNRTRDVLSLAYSSRPPLRAVVLPRTLRHVPALDTAQAVTTRVFVLSQGLINGKEMDMDRVDVTTHLGATEIWSLENVVGMDHPFHLHGFQFQILDRDGVAEPERRWKDSVNVPKHGTVRIVVRFDDHGGKWMYHCHIMDHEDRGMMGILQLN